MSGDMEENNSSGSNNSSCIPTQHLYTHLVPTPPTSSSSAHYMMTHMPFPSYYLSPTTGDDGRGFPPAAGTSGFCPGGLVHGEQRPPSELDFDSNDGESEEGIGSLEEPPKPPPNRGSGSKRSRAAEVHNLSEKRRRSRINEKMKALQNLIPNSNKTDKASMLDEAIEYLKQLQLQVQVLSMRNGLNLQSMYMPGALQALQSSQLCLGFGVDNGSAVNTSVGLLPLNLESSARNSYTLSDRVASSHESMIPTGVRNMSAPGTSFRMDPSHAQHGSFQLPVSSELCTENAAQRGQVDSGRSTTHLLGNDTGSVGLASTVQFRGQTSSMEGADRGILRGDSSEDMLSNDTANRTFIQHFHCLQTGSSFPTDDVKRESPEF